MSPLLRELSAPPRAPADMADILERHIGAGTDPQACIEALDALERVRGSWPSYYVRVTLRLLDAPAPPCARVRRIIETLRKWRYFSGA